MRFTYTPEGATPKTWPFDAAKLMNAEAEAIERQTKMTYAEWGEALDKGSMLALHALLWVFLKRETPTLKYDQVQFSRGEVALDFDDDETRTLIKELEATAATPDGLSDAGAEILAKLRADLGEDPDDPAEGDDQPASEATVTGEVVAAPKAAPTRRSK